MNNSISANREDVLKVFNCEAPSVNLVDLGGRVASFSKSAYLDFKRFLGMGDVLKSQESVTMLNTIGEIDERIHNLVDCPFRRVFLGVASDFHLQKNQDGSFLDEWGVKYVPRGHFNERTGHPLANAQSVKDILAHSWLDPEDPGRIYGLDKKIRSLKENDSIVIMAGHISAGIFQDCWNLRGMQRFLEDMLVNPAFAEALLDKVTEIHIRLWQVFLDVVGDVIDIVETADDLGSQHGLLISPNLYRKLIKPCHQKLNQAIRERTSAKIFFHSCGAIIPLIDDLIEINVDILNPIQPLGDLMAPEILSKRFGERLVFHGGLDVQNLLLKGNPEEIGRHVERYFQSLGTHRYIMAPANTILPGTPPENILAAYQAAKAFVT